jgi:hypothetical protein
MPRASRPPDGPGGPRTRLALSPGSSRSWRPTGSSRATRPPTSSATGRAGHGRARRTAPRSIPRTSSAGQSSSAPRARDRPPSAEHRPHGHGHVHDGPVAPADRRVRMAIAALLVPCALGHRDRAPGAVSDGTARNGRGGCGRVPTGGARRGRRRDRRRRGLDRHLRGAHGANGRRPARRPRRCDRRVGRAWAGRVRDRRRCRAHRRQRPRRPDQLPDRRLPARHAAARPGAAVRRRGGGAGPPWPGSYSPRSWPAAIRSRSPSSARARSCSPRCT